MAATYRFSNSRPSISSNDMPRSRLSHSLLASSHMMSMQRNYTPMYIHWQPMMREVNEHSLQHHVRRELRVRGRISDIDIGIRDYPKERFFHIYGRLLTELEHETDLVDFGNESALFSLLSGIGEVLRIA